MYGIDNYAHYAHREPDDIVSSDVDPEVLQAALDLFEAYGKAYSLYQKDPTVAENKIRLDEALERALSSGLFAVENNFLKFLND